jgi:hypothetical protein
MVIMVRPWTEKRVRMTMKRGTKQMKNLWRNLPTQRHHDPVKISQGPMLCNRILTVEDTTEDEVEVETGVDIDIVDSTVGGVIDIETGMAGVKGVAIEAIKGGC